MRAYIFSALAALAHLSLFLPEQAWSANWPAWRGPDGTGVTTETNLPLTWSPTKNVRWKTPLPERGNATPIIWGERIFITQNVGQKRTVTCFSRTDGKQLWQEGTDVCRRGANPCDQSVLRCLTSDGRRTCRCLVWVGRSLVLGSRWQRAMASRSRQAGSRLGLRRFAGAPRRSLLPQFRSGRSHLLYRGRKTHRQKSLADRDSAARHEDTNRRICWERKEKPAPGALR